MIELFIIVPLVLLYLTIAAAAGSVAARTAAQIMRSCSNCGGPWVWCSHQPPSTYRRFYDGKASFMGNHACPPNGVLHPLHMRVGIPAGLLWPFVITPAAIWLLATRTPTPLQEKLRLQEIERRYNEDQAKLESAGHDDLDDALAEAEAERSKLERVSQARELFRKRLQTAAPGSRRRGFY